MNPFLHLVIIVLEAIATGALFFALGSKELFLRLILCTLFVLCTYVASVVVLFRIMSSGI